MHERPAKGKRIPPAPRSQKARERLLAAFFVALTVAIVVVRIPRVHPVAKMHKLEQIGLVLLPALYDDEGAGARPMASGNTPFQVDVQALIPSLKFMEEEFGSDGQALQDYLAGKTGSDVCYLGHVVASDSAAHLLLDEYEDKGIDTVRDSNIELDHAIFHGPTLEPTRSLWRLTGLTRYPPDYWGLYHVGISNPYQHEEVLELIPMLWELPNEADPPTQQGGWVLDRSFDGYIPRVDAARKAKWQPYPGEFPMTEEFVRRLHEMRSMPPADWKKARARTLEDSPEAERIRQAIRPLQETRFLYGSPVFFSWAIAHLDRRPSVELDAHKGYRVVLRNESFARWSPYKLDTEAVIQLVAFPSDNGLPIGLEQRIPWRWQRKDDEACAVDLGQGAGYRWFGRAAPPWLGYVQERLALTGGSAYLDELMAWLNRNKDDSGMFGIALGALARHGAAAISFLEGEIDNPRVFAGDRGFWYLTRTLAEIPDTRAGELLVTLYNSEDEEVRESAQWALVERAGPEGKPVYLDLLRRKERLWPELARAALQFGGPEARSLLQELCAHSNERLASQARVALLERPRPEGLVGVMGAPVKAEPVPESTAPDGVPTFVSNFRGDLGDGSCLDLDTGRVYQVPVYVAVADDPGVTREWLRENGVDAVFEFNGERYSREQDTWDLTLLDFRALSEDSDGWKRSASEVVASLQRASAAPPDVREVVERTAPVVRLFETSEGASGVFSASACHEKAAMSKNPPKVWVRLSYKLVDGGPARLPSDTPEVDANTRDQPPKPPTPQYLIGITRRAIMEYAQAHEKRWPDSLEDVLAGGYLTVPDPDGFLADYEYVKPWISLEELEAVSPWWHRPEYQVYQTVLVVRRKQSPATD